MNRKFQLAGAFNRETNLNCTTSVCGIDSNNNIYKEETQNFWYDFELQKGEWISNGTVIPIKMGLAGVTPIGITLRIYDISGEHEKEILFARGELIDANTFVSQELSGTMFYEGTVTEIKIVKTSK